MINNPKFIFLLVVVGLLGIQNLTQFYLIGELEGRVMILEDK